MEQMVAEYHAFGVELVWVPDPHTLTLRACPRAESPRLLRDSDVASADPHVPEFSVRVARFFDLQIRLASHRISSFAVPFVMDLGDSRSIGSPASSCDDSPQGLTRRGPPGGGWAGASFEPAPVLVMPRASQPFVMPTSGSARRLERRCKARTSERR
jgi:hypothetical protein